MDIDEIKLGYRTEYTALCEICDQDHLVLTQKDDSPEYTTYVYFKCRCGNFIEFVLPVN